MPFPYFYDVTAWSQPLLFNVEGGYSGARARRMRTAAVSQLGQTRPSGAPGRPAVDRAVLDVAAVRARDRVVRLAALAARSLGASATARSPRRRSRPAGWPAPRCCSCPTATRRATRGPRRPLRPRRISVRRDRRAIRELGAGRRPLRRLARRRGARRGGRRLVRDVRGRRGRWASPRPGALVRTAVSSGSPLAAGVGPFAYAFWDSRYVMRGQRRAGAGAVPGRRRRRTSSSPATRTARRRPRRHRRRWSTSGSATAVRSRSGSSRTSARSPTARSACCATRSSVPTPPRRASLPCARGRRSGGSRVTRRGGCARGTRRRDWS